MLMIPIIIIGIFYGNESRVYSLVTFKRHFLLWRGQGILSVAWFPAWNPRLHYNRHSLCPYTSLHLTVIVVTEVKSSQMHVRRNIPRTWPREKTICFIKTSQRIDALFMLFT